MMRNDPFFYTLVVIQAETLQTNSALSMSQVWLQEN